MTTGFYTERTAEYIILHDLYARICDQYHFFYPFFYQKNRDDTCLSYANEIDGLHLAVCFARRPKAIAPDDPIATITFRPLLFEHTEYFAKIGIPSIIGAPLGTSIEKTCFGSKCCWFQLHPLQDNNYTTCEIVDDTLCLPRDNSLSILSKEDLLSLLSKAPQMCWREVLTIVQNWNTMYKMTHQPTLFYTIPGQKPVFIVYK